MKINALFILSIFTIGLASLSSCTEASVENKVYPDLLIEMEPARAAELSQKIREAIAIELAQGLELTLWASDSLVMDPVAISVDNNGAIYYTHAERLTNSEFDIRGHRDWMTTSQSWESVEDRRAFLRATFSPDSSALNEDLEDLNLDGSHDWRDLTVEKEKIWKVEDSDGDGVADKARLFLEDFHEEITDLANGVEFFDDEVFVAVGPDLWRTKDTNGDGRANTTVSISHGYAVHIGFGAHGMSGVTMGPDGRLWWGIGDIGMNVVDQSGKRWKYPNRGVIVRSEIDGSHFEVFSTGHRNTHEFTFDKYGNLISVDNDGDYPGERERLVYIVEGSDSGWRSNWQYGKYNDPDNNQYNVWIDEKLSVPEWDGQAAYILPPIQNYVNGPTGLVYNPGTALDENYYDHFFVAEFTGAPAISPIHAFTLKPKGATFELDSTREIVKGVLPTGLDFGPDGALYFGDWIDGWGAKDAGRMWKLDTENAAVSVIRKEVKALINAGLKDKTLEELNTYLAHQDMRIRQKAQFELVKRGRKGCKVLAERLGDPSSQLARIHAIWGLGQFGRKGEKVGEILANYLSDDDPEIVAQCMKMIGELRYAAAADSMIPLLKHENARIRFFAAQALGAIQHPAAVGPIISMLEANNGQDAWLRHSGCYALARIGLADPLIALVDHPSKAVRTAAVVALRRMNHEGVAKFLHDPEEYVVAEACRAINDDYSISKALPELANLLNSTPFGSEVILRRAINANLRLGTSKNLDELITFIQNDSLTEVIRAEAIAALSTWAKPSLTDRVDGRYRGAVVRDLTSVQQKLNPLISDLINDKYPVVQQAAIVAAKKLELSSALPELEKQMNNPIATVRAAALDALGALNHPDLLAFLEQSLADKNTLVRSKSLELLPKSSLPTEELIPLFRDIIEAGTTEEQQTALSTLGTMGTAPVASYLSQLFDQFMAGKIAPAIQLDLLDALELHGDQALAQKVSDYYSQLEAQEAYSSFQFTLFGGQRVVGSTIFYSDKTAQCVRCHSIFEYGGDAGPSLNGIGSRMTKKELLSSIINPNETISSGFGTVVLDLANGETLAGFYIGEDEKQISIREGKNPRRSIDKLSIKERIDAPSSMPSFQQTLTRKEIRDLVAFLSEIKIDPTANTDLN